jgi:hypothetical protein
MYLFCKDGFCIECKAIRIVGDRAYWDDKHDRYVDITMIQSVRETNPYYIPIEERKKSNSDIYVTFKDVQLGHVQ